MSAPESDRHEPDWDGLFQQLAQTPLQISLVVTGGGSGAVSRCLRRPGASQIFVEAVIPYSRTSLASFLTAAPRGTNASQARAHQMASTALARADALADREAPFRSAGIALTAALPTTVQSSGEERIHVALHTQSKRVLWSLDLTGSALDRQTAESIADEMVFVAISQLRQDRHPGTDVAASCHLLSGLELIRKDS